MSKLLILSRHAKARARDWVTNDIERPLRSRGIDQALSVGLKLRSLDIALDWIVSSSAVRTLETAKYINSQLDNSLAINTEENLYESGIEDILDSIHNLDESYKVVLYTLHNPAITELAYTLDRSKNRITHLRCAESLLIKIDSKWNEFNPTKDYSFELLKPDE